VVNPFHDFIGKRIVVCKDRYQWRGKLVEVRGVFGLFEAGGYQQIDHDKNQDKEKIRIGRALVPLEPCDAIYEEEGTEWIKR
jgi:hypothetical protein